jgi:hypothetical protein
MLVHRKTVLLNYYIHVSDSLLNPIKTLQHNICMAAETIQIANDKVLKQMKRLEIAQKLIKTFSEDQFH